MEKFSPEKAYLEAMAIKGVAKGKSEGEPSAAELKKADKEIDKLREFDPAMVEALGESVILREKLGPELTAIAVKAHEEVAAKILIELNQEADKIIEDPANESADFKDIFKQARPLMKGRLVDKFFKEWEEAMRSHKDFAGKEKLLNESLPELKELCGKIVDSLLDKIESETSSNPDL